ncbi:MAG: phenylacetate--CoA ligase family protein [Phycisphaerae bacterium]
MTTQQQISVGGPSNPGAHLFWPAERWQSLQRDRLATHLQHASSSPLYAPLKIENRKSKFKNPLALLQSLPLTTKDDLARSGPAAHAVPPESVAEWVCTSGTLGKPLDIPLTPRDLQRLAENEATALSLAGITKGDLVLLAVGMERMFVAGLAYWLGAQKLGATCVRVGPQIATDPRYLANLLTRLRPAKNTFLIAVPSFLTNVESPAQELTGIIAIGESVRAPNLEPNQLAHRLTSLLRCPVMSTYALTETCTTFAESPHCKGGHLNPALALLEILDDNNNPIPDNSPGEIVITPLGVEGLPLLRFRTGDIATLHTDPCPCGRTTPRLGPILGRKQQLLKVRGTSLFPNAIIETVRATDGVLDCLVVAEHTPDLSDQVTIYAAATTPTAQQQIENRLRATLRVTPHVNIIPEDQLRQMMSTGTRKLRHFLDRRTEFRL